MKFLKDLCLAASPSSNESEAIKVWDDYCSKTPGASHVYSDNLGNSVWGLGDGPKKILLSAHIDTVCARVTKITDKGTLMFTQSAGICLKSLISSDVLVCTDTARISGVVQKLALHLDDDYEKVGDFLDYRINIGAGSKEEVEELGIYPGCVVMYRPEIRTGFGKENFIVGTGLDDKAGLWIVYDVLKNLADNIPDAYTIYFGACTQEETGLNGAKRMARNINPDISIDIDCTFADTELAGKDFRDLDINLGDGALIAYGPEKDAGLNRVLKDVAGEEGINYKTYATRAGGTNTKSFQDFAENPKTTLLSYGLLGMHSSREIVKESDLRNCSKLLTETLRMKRV